MFKLVEAHKKIPVEDFLQQINVKFALDLSKDSLQQANQTLRSQWVTNAWDLEAVSADIFKFFKISNKLSNAIQTYFDEAKAEIERAHTLTLIEEKDEKMPAPPPLLRRQSSMQIIRSALESVCEPSFDNPRVLFCFRALLKKAMLDANKLQQSVLREFLKRAQTALNAVPPSQLVDERYVPHDELEYTPFTCHSCQKSFNQAPSQPRIRSVILPCCGVTSCVECLANHVGNMVRAKSVCPLYCPACPAELAITTLQLALTDVQLDAYLDASLQAYLAEDETVVACVNPSCNLPVSVYVEEFDPSLPITIKDDFGDLMRPEPWKHYNTYRICCMRCTKNFCVECKAIPYHQGYTCAEWVHYQNAASCRFCKVKLGPNNDAKLQEPALANVCRKAECIEKSQKVCIRMLQCGCPCGGLRDELKCPPCLEHDLECAEDYCSICFVEALNEAPVIQPSSACEHVFHHHCVEERIRRGANGARLVFDFLDCCLCHARSDHIALRESLAPHLETERIVRGKAMERLVHDGLENDPEIKCDNGRFFGKPEEFAMHRYVFFPCFACHKPFFGGAYECQAANVVVNKHDLRCSDCSLVSQETCATHGTEWLSFKCRFCCQLAVWHCWDLVHFCEPCHNNWTNLVAYRGDNVKKLWEFPQCPSLKRRLDEIANDPNLSEEEKERRAKKCTSSSADCPLGCVHPPNGIEYGLGCTMCADKPQSVQRE